VTTSSAKARERLGAGVDLDAGNDAGLLERLRERHAGERLLADRLVVEDRAADAAAEVRRRHDHVAVGTRASLGLGDAELGEALVAGRRALVHREEAAVAGDERAGACR
jgi:hypothetical protein